MFSFIHDLNVQDGLKKLQTITVYPFCYLSELSVTSSSISDVSILDSKSLCVDRLVNFFHSVLYSGVWTFLTLSGHLNQFHLSVCFYQLSLGIFSSFKLLVYDRILDGNKYESLIPYKFSKRRHITQIKLICHFSKNMRSQPPSNRIKLKTKWSLPIE